MCHKDFLCRRHTLHDTHMTHLRLENPLSKNPELLNVRMLIIANVDSVITTLVKIQSISIYETESLCSMSLLVCDISPIIRHMIWHMCNQRERNQICHIKLTITTRSNPDIMAFNPRNSIIADECCSTSLYP